MRMPSSLELAGVPVHRPSNIDTDGESENNKVLELPSFSKANKYKNETNIVIAATETKPKPIKNHRRRRRCSTTVLRIGLELVLVRILTQLGLTASASLVEYVVDTLVNRKRPLTEEDTRRFPFKFPLVKVIEFGNQKLVDSDILQIACGAFPRLTVLKLHGNGLQSLPGLHTLRNLRMLDLSGNNFKGLPTGESVWIEMKKLQVLFLHDNAIEDSSTLIGLSACPSLLHLTLRNNPLTTQPHYRQTVARRVSQLIALDEFVFTDYEIHSCPSCLGGGFSIDRHRFVTEPGCDRLSLGGVSSTFSMTLDERSYSRYFRTGIGLRRTDLNSLRGPARVCAELQAHVDALVLVRKYTSPAVTIQRVFRGKQSRLAVDKVHARRIRLAIRLQAIARGWRLRAELKRQELELLSEVAPSLLHDYDTDQARKRRFVKKKATDTEKAATLIQRMWVKKHMSFHRTISAIVIQRFFRQYSNLIGVEASRLSSEGVFKIDSEVLILPHRCLGLGAVSRVLHFAVIRALRIEGIIPLGLSVDDSAAKAIISRSEMVCMIAGTGKKMFCSPGGVNKALRVETNLKRRFDALKESSNLVNMELKNGRDKDKVSMYQVYAEKLQKQIGLTARQYYEAKQLRENLQLSLRTSTGAVGARSLKGLRRATLLCPTTGIQRMIQSHVLRRRVSGFRRPKRWNDAATLFPTRDLVSSFRIPACMFAVALPNARALAWTLKIFCAFLRRPELVSRLGLTVRALYESSASDVELDQLVKVYPRLLVVSEAASVKIQSLWRAHHFRVNNDIDGKILERRAAVAIQRCWRMVGFWSRMSFLENLSAYLRAIDTVDSDIIDSTYYVTDQQNQSKHYRREISQSVKATGRPKANSSSSLYLEENILRAIRKLKGRMLTRDDDSILAAQEVASASDCCFNFSNSLRLMNGKKAQEKHFISSPPSHHKVLQYSRVNDGAVVSVKGMNHRGSDARIPLRVGIPKWMKIDLDVIADNRNSNVKVGRADLGKLLTRGALVTTGELVVPSPGGARNGKYFCKVSMSQRLMGRGASASSAASTNSPTGIVLVRLKFRNKVEMRARAAMIFARTWQSRSKQTLTVVAEHMLADCFERGRERTKDSIPWGVVPSRYGVIIKQVIARYGRLDEDLQMAQARANAQRATRGSTLQERRDRRANEVDKLRNRSSDDNEEEEVDGARKVLDVEKKERLLFKQTMAEEKERDDAKYHIVPVKTRLSIDLRRGSQMMAEIDGKAMSMLSPASPRQGTNTDSKDLLMYEAQLRNLKQIPQMVHGGQKVDELYAFARIFKPNEYASSMELKGSEADIADHMPEPVTKQIPEIVRNERAWLNSHRVMDVRSHEDSSHQRCEKLKFDREVGSQRAKPFIKQKNIGQENCQDEYLNGEKELVQRQPAPPEEPCRPQQRMRPQQPQKKRFVANQPSFKPELGPAQIQSDLEFKKRKKVKKQERMEQLRLVEEKIQNERAGKKARKEEMSFVHSFATRTNRMDKNELRRKKRSVVHREISEKVERVESGKREMQHRRERIERYKTSVQSTQQKEARIYRMYTHIQLKGKSEKDETNLKKKKMRIEHEKGIKRVIQAIRTLRKNDYHQ